MAGYQRFVVPTELSSSSISCFDKKTKKKIDEKRNFRERKSSWNNDAFITADEIFGAKRFSRFHGDDPGSDKAVSGHGIEDLSFRADKPFLNDFPGSMKRRADVRGFGMHAIH